MGNADARPTADPWSCGVEPESSPARFDEGCQGKRHDKPETDRIRPPVWTAWSTEGWLSDPMQCDASVARKS